MSYEYDIFISYRRDEGSETLNWIKQHFCPLLSLRVGQELSGGRVKVFLDEQIESGTSWPHDLGKKLGRSKILVALLSKNYFSSPWCALKLSHMLAREKSKAMRTAAKPQGLIVPLVIHDCDPPPAAISHIQNVDIKRCFNPRMRRDGQLGEELDEILTREAEALANAINAAPRWTNSWSLEAADAFYHTLIKGHPSQKTRPRYTE
jgi:hypothetical protein